MSSRDRTKLFIQLRKTYHQSTSFHRSEKGLEDSIELTDFSLNNKLKVKAGYHSLVDVEEMEPSWLNIKYELDEELKKVDTNFSKLKSLHKKRLLPGFKDRSLEETQISELTNSVFEQLKQGQQLTKKLDRFKVGKGEAIVKNAQIAYCTKLQLLSNDLKTLQTTYLKKITLRENNNLDLINFEGIDPSSRQLYQDTSQLQLVQDSSWEQEFIQRRDSEISSIVQSIQNISNLFQSLSTFVIDQGSLLDRIDYNVEQVSNQVQDAVHELHLASEYERTGASKYCIYFLLAMIALLILLIWMKKSVHPV